MITVAVIVIMSAGFLHMGENFGKSSPRKWWLKLAVLWFLGSALAGHAVGAPIGVMMPPTIVPLAVGLFLAEMASWFRNGFYPRKPGRGMAISGIVLWLFFSAIPTSLSPLIDIVMFVLYTLPAGLVLGGAYLSLTEEPPQPPEGPRHPHHDPEIA